MNIPPTAPAPVPTVDIDKVVNEYLVLKQWLDDAKKREATARAFIANLLFGDKKLPDGSFKPGTLKTLGATFKGTLKQKREYNVLVESMVSALTEAQLTADEGTGLIKTTYDVSLTVYNKLPDEKKRIVDKCITVRPASLELDLELLPKSPA